jgi:PAS domain S-box-containing protein
MVEEAPIMLWTAGADTRCTFFNKRWLDFTGLSLREQTEQDWVAGVHPADRERSVNTYLSAFKSREDFSMEYRVLRRDGVYGWVFHNGVPRYAADGSFIGYVGSRFDVTNHVYAQEHVREESIQLINAHHTERCRIAQELHDDVAQKIAALSIGLGRFRDENRHLTTLLDEVQLQLSEICRHIIRLSDKLRPVTVEGRGLSAALRILCERATVDERKVLFVQTEEDVPRLSEDQSRAIYHIAKESVRNAATHSNATNVRVELSVSAGTIRLCVRDNGRGFVVDDISKRGLGLSVMSARFRNAGGDFRIVSSPGEGTAVMATLTVAQFTKATSVG